MSLELECLQNTNVVIGQVAAVINGSDIVMRTELQQHTFRVESAALIISLEDAASPTPTRSTAINAT